MSAIIRAGALVVGVVVACGGAPTPAPAVGTPTPPITEEPPVAADDTEAPRLIELWFRDASVPPPDHRSYYISVTAASIRRVVDSYGDLVSDETVPLTAAQYAGVVAALARHGLREQPATEPEPGCTGGTSHALALTYAARETPRLEVAHCGGADTGTLAGDVRGFAAELAALLPPPR
ncbi:MAG: hypothetical protein R2939_03960 [Kofleriaceae bacterium]